MNFIIDNCFLMNFLNNINIKKAVQCNNFTILQ